MKIKFEIKYFGNDKNLIKFYDPKNKINLDDKECNGIEISNQQVLIYMMCYGDKTSIINCKKDI